MYRLDKMVIQGFKSFYDRTEISLPERITAVVGPNGCGKSNISDAIHWVLGEQKVRTLRGEKMEDVIFNGSEARKALGMAEVSLFLNRTDEVAEDDGGNGRGADLPLPGADMATGPTGEEAAVHPADPDAAPADDVSGGNGSAPEAVGGNGSAPVIEPDVLAAFPDGNGDGAEAVEGRWPASIQVTRRLFRDGQSDYRIDGARCRLRDVRDLLQRISVGSGASSIIEQGRVDQIVASKPRERRVLIEEAAGIAGFKAKKREAVLKLEATELNLTRLEDIISEVRRQISSTKRQAAKARRYARLMEERRGFERILYHHKAAALDAQLSDLARERDAVRDEEAAAAASLAAAEAAAERIRAEVEEGDRRLNERREAVHALDLQVDREERGLAEAGRQSAELLRLAAAGEVEAEELAGRGSETREQVGVREAEALELAGELRVLATMAESEDTALVQVRETIAASEADLEGRRGRLFELLDAVAELKGRLRNLEEDRRRAGVAAERAEREAGEAGRERDVLGGKAAALDAEIATGAARVEVLERETAEARERIDTAAAERREAAETAERARLERTSLAERLNALQTLDRDASAQGRAARAAGDSSRGVVADFIRPPRELEEAAESCLTDLLSAAVVGDAAAAREAAGRLDGRASFLIAEHPAMSATDGDLPPDLAGDPRVRGRLADLLEAQEVAHGAVAALAAGVVVVRDGPAALELSRQHPSRTFLAETGELLRPGGLLTVGRPEEPAGGILTLRRRIQEAREGMGRAQESARRAAERVAELDAAIARDETRIAEAGRERSERDVAVAEMRERRRALQEQLDRAVRHHKVRAEEADRERADAAAWTEETARVQEEMAVAEGQRRETEETIREGTSELERCRAEEASRSEALAEGRTRLEGVRVRLDSAADEAVRLRHAADEFEARARGLRDDAGGKRRKSADLEDLAARTAASLKRNLEARDAERSRLESEATTLEEARRLGAERDRQAKELKRGADDIRERRTRVEVSHSRADSERGFLEQSCLNDLGQGVAEASAALQPGESDRPLEDVEAEIGRIRAKIDGIGPVNVMAVDEFDELEQRYTFLTTQQKDLQDSVKSLRDTITRINRRSRERFQGAYEEIRTNFQETFRGLFGGGRADLLLEEEAEDVLEAGVEITAQPPGKRLQRIALLSGGEKALTAIALLFSIFRYRPSPFCVLDEVDAPLDEVNIHRYTELLRRMALDTQFVVITHNKRTMERADVLYGVTMEEPGVSRLVSVRFESDGRLAREDGAGEVSIEPQAVGPAATMTPPGA